MSAPPPESRSGPRTGQESPSAPRRSQPAHPQSPASSERTSQERYSQERYSQEPYSSESSLFERSRSDARLRPPFQNPDAAPPPERPADVPPWEPEAAPTRLHGRGIWFYIPTEALESQEVVDRLQRMLSAYCGSDKAAPTGRPEMQSVSHRAWDSTSGMACRAGLSAPWKNGKDFTKISGLAELQTEISETSETAGRKFQNEMHRIIPEIQILQAASANTSISSSSSETSAKNEIPSHAETALKSAEGLAARAPLRSAAKVGVTGDSSSATAFSEAPISGSASRIEATASDCDEPTSPSDVDASRPPNASETTLLRSFMTTVRRYSGHEGMPARWSPQPELERWFLSTLRKEADGKALGLDLNEVLVSWSGYLARRAAANQPFTTPSESFSLQLDYARNLQRRKDAASTATPPPPPRPVRPTEGATACHEHGNFRFLAGQMYPIDVSLDEYVQLCVEVLGAPPDLTPERFRELALEDGLVPN